jgi:hypothetical protein
MHSGELHNLYLSLIKESEVGRACGRHGRGEKCVQGFDGKPRRKKTWKTQGVVGRMGSKWTLGDWLGGCGVDSPGSG